MALYKYVRPERVDVLRNGLIRLTQPTALNDPFELKPFFRELVTNQTLVKYLDGQTIDLDAAMRSVVDELTAEQLRGLTKEQALSLLRAHMTPQAAVQGISLALNLMAQFFSVATAPVQKSLTERLGSDVGILSLTEVADNPPMWAHYAADHTGFLLVFDERDSFFNRRRSEGDEFYYLRKVIYRPAPSVHSELMAMTGDDIFVTKREEWAYEREWRLLAPLKGASQTIQVGDESCYLFVVPPTAIRGVVLGARASEGLEKEIRTLTETRKELNHLTIEKARLNGDGTISFTTIS